MASAENDATARGASSELPEPLARQEFSEYFRRSRTAMMLADDDRRYLAINHAACLLIGVEPSEIVGRRIDDLTPQEDKAQLPALLDFRGLGGGPRRWWRGGCDLWVGGRGGCLCPIFVADQLAA